MVLGKHNVRVRALAGRIAASLGNALVAPVIAYVPEGASIRPPATCASPGRSASPTARSRRRSSTRAKPAPGGVSRHRADRRPRRLPEEPVKVAAKLDREWAASPVRVHAIEEYYARSPRRSRRRCASRASATPRSARMPASPTPRSRSRSTRGSCARSACTTAARSPGRRRVRRSAPGERRRRPGRRRADRRANARSDPRGSAHVIDPDSLRPDRVRLASRRRRSPSRSSASACVAARSASRRRPPPASRRFPACRR